MNEVAPTVEELVPEFDWDRIKLLLDIAELSRGRPNLKAINDAAEMELHRLANPVVEVETSEEEAFEQAHPEVDEHGNLIEYDEEGNVIHHPVGKGKAHV
jgi:hypothetical protein